MIEASKNHNNKRPWNWLVYQCSDQFLNKYVPHYKGNLYDLGCGIRSYEEFFLKFSDSYVGIDWGSSIHDTKADIFADLNQPLPVESAVADTVVCLSVLEHLSEPQTLLNEAYRIMKPGATMILQVPWQWKLHEEPYDFFRYTPYGLQHLFAKAGFVNIEVEATSGFFSMWILKVNYFTLGLITGPRLVRAVKRGLFQPMWYVGQKLAPTLDKLDKNWAVESQGYYVIAKKGTA
jgi:SAM-dependent methyltransferase